MACFREIRTLDDAIQSGRFGWKAIKRMNEGIKKKQAKVLGREDVHVNVETLDHIAMEFKLCESSTAPLEFIKTYDATSMTFFHLPSAFSVCDGCRELMPAALLQQCSGCKIHVYCSKKCQKAHWPQHKGSCRMLQKGNSLPKGQTVIRGSVSQ